MSTTTDNQQAPHSSSLRGVVARHPVTSFLIMAFVFGWGGMLPLLLSENGPVTVVPIELPWMPFAAILSIFGLALPAFLVTAATNGKDGVRELLGRILRWRVGVHWYLIALFGLPVTMLLATIPFLGVAPLEELAQKWGCSSPCSCLASSCRSCTPTCGKNKVGWVTSSPRCKKGAVPCWRASSWRPSSRCSICRRTSSLVGSWTNIRRSVSSPPS